MRWYLDSRANQYSTHNHRSKGFDHLLSPVLGMTAPKAPCNIPDWGTRSPCSRLGVGGMGGRQEAGGSSSNGQGLLNVQVEGNM
jgi:hypothetical protein